MINNNCLIDELKKLKESSKEAVENITSFSEFKNYMHVKRNVQDELFNIIDKSSKSNSSKLILVCGGVGDGKSHIISYFKNNYPNMMLEFDIHNDATESFEPGKTSIDTLNDVLKDFNDDNILHSNKKLILAINLGALSNFIDSKYQDNFKNLKKYVEDKKILDVDISDNSYEEESNFQFINFSDYHIYSLTEEKAKSQYVEDIINKIIQDDERNVFKNSYKSNCLNCDKNYKCPIKINYEMLMKEPVKEKLIDVLIECVVKDKLIVSTRSLLNFIYDFIVNTELDNKNNEELKQYIDKINCDDFIKCIFVSNLFEHKELSQILYSLSKIDPINSISEDLDNIIIKLNITEDIAGVFNSYLNIDGNNYLESLMSKNDVIEDEKMKLKTKTEQNYLIDSLINMFIRLNIFIPRENLNLDDKIYLDYMKNLYYWNIGERRKLANLYNNVKVAIYNWNGEVSDGRINISIGKNQMKYKISQKLNLSADLSNIKVNGSEELLKFNPSLIIGYKSEDKGTNYKIDIDFNLYELLMRIKDGYRPNKNDKYNYINFVEFINKIQKLGSQNKEIYIEDKQGLGISNYKLVYNQAFEVFEFKSTNEV
ncbi:DNA phosphorothioation-dependent restriction protein DptF [Romboutsia ilealis]|uniref:DNA phosphorothioation-dependent restriction protein DptF n=1 Tax=Romboutsia ilealis TaxID=1115758 RepID=UPI00272A8DFC|nr:DNA phosphorothioation-dependent restriction protein DptF [Romboutsia ilealis]